MSVLADLDLVPGDAGVVLPSAGRSVSWAELDEALGQLEPLSPAGRARVTALLTLHQVLADADDPAGTVHRAARLLALPPGHALHPGPDWVRDRVPGGALDLGIGLLGLATGPDEVRPLPPSVARTLGDGPRVPRTGPADDGPHHDGPHQDGPHQDEPEQDEPEQDEPEQDGPEQDGPEQWWPDLVGHADRMGELAAHRIARDGRPVLRPTGGCDVLSLLASPTLRAALADGDGSGMRALAVPTRRRGWFDLAQVDPAYVAVAWSATSAPDRGVPTPLLVTRHEVCAPLPDGRVVDQSLDRRS